MVGPIRLCAFGITPLAMMVGVSGWHGSVMAQILPDQTLGLESSVVENGVLDGRDIDLIQGGAARTNVLFQIIEEPWVCDRLSFVWPSVIHTKIPGGLKNPGIPRQSS